MVDYFITLLIDLDAARRLCWLPASRPGRSPRRPEEVFEALYAMVAAVLGQVGWTSARVRVRVYHGFFQGKTQTRDRMELQSLQVPRVTFDKVIFETPPELAENLTCGGYYSKLYNTVRLRDDGNLEQKMVDTALASDLLHLARGAVDTDRFVILGKDTDLLPPIITAHAWRKEARLLWADPGAVLAGRHPDPIIQKELTALWEAVRALGDGAAQSSSTPS